MNAETITNIPPDEREMLAREMGSVDLATDGRNVEMLCVPFDVPTTVSDPPDFQPYEEAFARGAFDGTINAPNRVYLEFEHHHPGLSGIIGHGAHLEERDDGLYGRFRVHDNIDGDKALSMIREGVLTAASVFFEPMRDDNSVKGLVRRLKVRLDRVALCRVGAYPQAKVLAVRSKPTLDIPSLTFDPALAELLSAQGVTVPERLQASE